MTPEEFLADHPLTKEMRRRGLSDNQLAQFAFHGATNGLPFSAWSFRGPADMPTSALGIAKAFCALRWLVLDDPEPSRDADDAWNEISEVMSAPIFAKGLKTLEQQKTNQVKATAATTKYTAEMRSEWQRIADEPALAGKSKSNKAQIIAARLRLPAEAESTIRRSIK